MKVVRIKNNIVQEIIPDYALPVEEWYGSTFAAQCVEAPDEVAQGWVYQAETRVFTEPLKPDEPTPAYTDQEVTQQAITDLELSDIVQGQAITDLEIMILEGQAHA